MATTTTADGIQVSSSTDAFGNSFTTAIANSGLDSEDFLKLMLTELSLQDASNTYDTKEMIQNELSMSNMENNTQMTKAIQSLSTSLSNTTLKDAATLIDKTVEVGTINSDGSAKQYKVSSVENDDGTVKFSAYELTGYYDTYSFKSVSNEDSSLDSTSDNDSLIITDNAGNEHKIETKGKTYKELADELNNIDGITAGMQKTSDGEYQLKMYVSGGSSSISSSGDLDLSYTSSSATTYSDTAETLSYNDITKIY